MLALIGVFLVVVILACVGGWLWGNFMPSPRAGSRPADDPDGGYATPAQLRERLSAEAVRAAGAQVRPGLPRQLDPVKTTRKGLPRGRR